MELSATKTVELIVSSRKSHKVKPISINNTEVEQVSSVKLLGVVTDSHLTFREHVHKCKTKANQRTFWLRTLSRYGANRKSLLQMYISYIRSLFEYAAPAWFPFISKELKTTIERVERAALRIIFPEHSYKAALQESNMRPICDHLTRLQLLHFRKMLKPEHPLHHLAPLTRKESNLRPSRQKKAVVIPCHRTNLRAKSFIVSSSKAHNLAI